MTRKKFMNGVFVVGFVVLLADGAAAIWLGQLWGRTPVVLAGLLLLAAAIGTAFWHRRWRSDLASIEQAQRERRDSIDELRSVLENPRAHRRRN